MGEMFGFHIYLSSGPRTSYRSAPAPQTLRESLVLTSPRQVNELCILSCKHPVPFQQMPTVFKRGGFACLHQIP